MELPNWMTRALGSDEGVIFEIPEGGANAASLTLRPDSSGRLFVPLHAAGREGARRRLVFLRVLPLDPTPVPSGAPASRWSEEWRDLAAPGAPPRGLLRVLPGRHATADRPPVFPPLYVCAEKQVLVPVVCPGCSGALLGAAPPCPICGFERVGEELPEPDRTPLGALWHRVRGKTSTAGGGPFELPCLSCDRRERCYPASGPSSEAGGAGSVLFAWSERPWGGAFVEPFHLPFRAWCRLVSGAPWEQVRADLSTIPGAVLAEADARMAADRPTLFPAGSGEPFALETALLRLEMVRQLLSGLAFLAVDRGHPHLGLSEEALWFRLEPSDSLGTSLWAASVRLLDTAPGWFGAGKEDYRQVPGRPADMMPLGCDRAESWSEGLAIPRAGAPSDSRGRIAVDFLPHVPFDRPPGKGDAVVLVVASGPGGSGERIVRAIVEVAFPEVCSIAIGEDSFPDEDTRRMFGAGTPLVKLRVVRDHSVVDDLFAAGTLLLSSLAADRADLAGLDAFRSGIAERLRAAGGSSSVESEIRRALRASGLFDRRRGADPLESGQPEQRGKPVAPPVSVERLVSLGLRLCGAIPNGYPYQDHEPVGGVEREQTYESVLAAVTAASREMRERLLGIRPPESEVPRILVDYLSERALAKRGGAGRPEARGRER